MFKLGWRWVIKRFSVFLFFKFLLLQLLFFFFSVSFSRICLNLYTEILNLYGKEVLRPLMKLRPSGLWLDVQFFSLTIFLEAEVISVVNDNVTTTRTMKPTTKIALGEFYSLVNRGELNT